MVYFEIEMLEETNKERLLKVARSCDNAQGFIDAIGFESWMNEHIDSVEGEELTAYQMRAIDEILTIIYNAANPDDIAILQAAGDTEAEAARSISAGTLTMKLKNALDYISDYKETIDNYEEAKNFIEVGKCGILRDWQIVEIEGAKYFIEWAY